MQIKLGPLVERRLAFMKMRINRLTAVLIDAVLENRAAHCTNSIARALLDNGVPVEVAVRVITRPWQRRAYISVPGTSMTAEHDQARRISLTRGG
jgi:hypothetical protein